MRLSVLLIVRDYPPSSTRLLPSMPGNHDFIVWTNDSRVVINCTSRRSKFYIFTLNGCLVGIRAVSNIHTRMIVILATFYPRVIKLPHSGIKCRLGNLLAAIELIVSILISRVPNGGTLIIRMNLTDMVLFLNSRDLSLLLKLLDFLWCFLYEGGLKLLFGGLRGGFDVLRIFGFFL